MPVATLRSSPSDLAPTGQASRGWQGVSSVQCRGGTWTVSRARLALVGASQEMSTGPWFAGPWFAGWCEVEASLANCHRTGREVTESTQSVGDREGTPAGLP